jgi:hypothetical protein
MVQYGPIEEVVDVEVHEQPIRGSHARERDIMVAAEDAAQASGSAEAPPAGERDECVERRNAVSITP